MTSSKHFKASLEKSPTVDSDDSVVFLFLLLDELVGSGSASGPREAEPDGEAAVAAAAAAAAAAAEDDIPQV